MPNLILQLITKLARTTCVCVLFTHRGYKNNELSLRFLVYQFYKIGFTDVTTFTVHPLCNCYFRSKSDEKKLNAFRGKYMFYELFNMKVRKLCLNYWLQSFKVLHIRWTYCKCWSSKRFLFCVIKALCTVYTMVCIIVPRFGLFMK